MKKVLSLVLALVMVLGSFSMVSAAAYDDVTGTDVASAVDRLSLLGILEGYPDGTFKPAGQITRAEFAAVAVRAKGLAQVAKAAQGLPTGFSDVPGTFWASGVVGTAARLGIVTGRGNNLFDPQAPVKYEEAITMLVRALGYEASAQAKGGYPYGYLIVANEVGLLDEVIGTQGVPATRGIVAQLTDNALEIEMMIQVGFGSEVKWVVSGTEDTKVKTLLTELGFEVFEGRLIDFDADDSEITLDNGRKLTLEVAEDFDFEAYFGLEITVWYDDNDLAVAYKANDKALLDAVEVTKGEVEIKLVDADKKYDVDKNAIVYIDGTEEDVEDLTKGLKLNYAKVVLNDEGDVAFINAYNWDGFLVVEKVDEYDIFAIDGEELDVEDFVIVKDGKTISVEEVVEGDMFFYNEDAEYAEVYNNDVEGEIKRIYSDRIDVEGKDYKYADLVYLNEDGNLVTLTDVAAEQFEEEGKVTLFKNRAGVAVYINGDLGIAETNSFYGYVIGAGADYTGSRNVQYRPLDIVNENGDVVKYDLKVTDITDLATGFDKQTWSVGNVISITVDEDGDIENIEGLSGTTTATTAKVEDRYVSGKKLLSSAVVYDVEKYVSTTKEKDIKVSTLKDAEFDEILAGVFHYNTKDEIVAIVVSNSDLEGEVTLFDAVATADAVALRGNKTWRLKLNVNGEEKTYFTKDETNVANASSVVKGNFLVVGINDVTGEVDTVATAPTRVVTTHTVTTVNLTNNTIDAFRVADAYILDGTDSYKTLRLRDIEKNDTLAVLRVADGSSYAQYVVRTAKAGTTAPVATVSGAATLEDVDVMSKEAYINGAWVSVSGTTAELDTLATLKGQKVAFKVVGGRLVAASVVLESTLLAQASGVATTFAATEVAGTEAKPTVSAGYTIAVKTTSNAAVYDAAAKVQSTGTASVVYTVTHTASGAKADTATVTVTVTVTP